MFESIECGNESKTSSQAFLSYHKPSICPDDWNWRNKVNSRVSYSRVQFENELKEESCLLELDCNVCTLQAHHDKFLNNFSPKCSFFYLKDGFEVNKRLSKHNFTRWALCIIFQSCSQFSRAIPIRIKIRYVVLGLNSNSVAEWAIKILFMFVLRS